MGKKKDAWRAKVAYLMDRVDEAAKARRDMARERGEALQRLADVRQAIDLARSRLQPLRALIKAGQIDEADATIVQINTILGNPPQGAAPVPPAARPRPEDPRTPFFPPDVILVNGEPFRLTPLEDKPKKRKGDK